MENENTIKKDFLKEKIILFVIGVLVGAVISTGAFFAYIKMAGVGCNSGEHSMQMPGGTPPEMPSGENGPSGQGGTPPELPSGQDESDSQKETSPEKPDDNSKSTDS